MMTRDDEGWRPTNREKSMAPKMSLHWCNGCDANLVGDWERCNVCGRRCSRYRWPIRDARRT